MGTSETVASLLLDQLPAWIIEATVRRPPRSTRWVAVFTGEEPGRQIARSTGLTNRAAALALARKWEAEARALRLSRTNDQGGQRRAGRPTGLSQDEVAAFLGVSPRTVRAIERRALRKLRNVPAARSLWREWVG